MYSLRLSGTAIPASIMQTRLPARASWGATIEPAMPVPTITTSYRGWSTMVPSGGAAVGGAAHAELLEGRRRARPVAEVELARAHGMGLGRSPRQAADVGVGADDVAVAGCVVPGAEVPELDDAPRQQRRRRRCAAGGGQEGLGDRLVRQPAAFKVPERRKDLLARAGPGLGIPVAR